MLKLAVIGLGKWGMRHVTSATASGRFEVVKGVDHSDVSADFPVTRNLDEVLSDPDIDAVSIATPHSLHAEQIRLAAEAGKHILTEKPFALSIADAQANIKVTQDNNVVLAIGHDQRFYPSVDLFRKMIADGDLGQLASVQSVLSHDFTKKTLEDLNAQAKMDEGDPNWWRLNLVEAPLGPMVHLGIHHLDLFIHLFGRIKWVLVTCPTRAIKTTFPDTMLVTFGFESGQIGSINSSLASPLNSRMLLSGSEGWMEGIGPDALDVYTTCSLNQVKYRLNGQDPQTETFPLIDSVAANFSAFADAIEGKADYPVPLTELLHNAEVLDACIRSLDSGAVEQVTQ